MKALRRNGPILRWMALTPGGARASGIARTPLPDSRPAESRRGTPEPHAVRHPPCATGPANIRTDTAAVS